MSISVPPVLVVGQPFTVSVHSDVPQRLCPTVSKTPVSSCMLFWDIGLRPLSSGGLTDPFESNLAFPNAQCPLAMGGYNGSHGPFYPATRTSMSCRTAVQLPSFFPNPDGRWWLLGASIQGWVGQNIVIEALEVPVEVTRGPCSGANCHSLEIRVSQLERLRSGLAVHSFHYKVWPVDFTQENFDVPLTPRELCQSGCVDLTLTVLDARHLATPVRSAILDVSLGELHPGAQAWDHSVFTPPVYGEGELCRTNINREQSECGASLSDLRTNVDGQVNLRYWAPGVIADATTALVVTATCEAASGCTVAPTAPVTSETTLSIKPYDIYEHHTELSGEDLAELAEWSGGGSKFTDYLEHSTLAFDTLKSAVQFVAEAERAAKAAHEVLAKLEDVEPIVLGADVALVINVAFEAQGMFALFLEDSGLSPIGIGSDPFEASASGIPTATFVREMMNQLAFSKAFSGVFSPLRLGTGGFWWASAQDVHRIALAGGRLTLSNVFGWSLDTSVYEVSHCDPQRGSCGNGYGNRPGDAEVLHPGIEPELAFELSLVHDGSAVEQLGFAIPYDALAWTTTQPDLLGVIPDF